MQNSRNWKEQLAVEWNHWEPVLEAARRRNSKEPPSLEFPQSKHKKSAWIEHPASWVSLERGLGDFARFALASYLTTADGNASGATRLTNEKWTPVLTA